MAKAYIYSSVFEQFYYRDVYSNYEYDVYYPDTKERVILSYSEFMISFPPPPPNSMYGVALGHLGMLPIITFGDRSKWNHFLLTNNVGEPINKLNYTIRSLQMLQDTTYNTTGWPAAYCNREFVLIPIPYNNKSMGPSEPIKNNSPKPIIYYPKNNMLSSYEIELLNAKEKIPDYVDNTKVSTKIFSNIAKYSHEEYQYINLLENILTNGTWEEGRNGRTQSIFGASMRFSLKDGKIPILTTKQTAWITCLKELLWFIRGDTDNKNLTNQKVHIWDGNSTREFLDSRGLHYAEGILGPIYGYQWRNYNAPYDHNKVFFERNNKLKEPHIEQEQEEQQEQVKEKHDQLQQIIDALKDPNQRTNRRLIMTAWNPCQLDEMALPPCHVLCQFNVHDGNKLSCSMYQRSCDFFLGVPFNIASYSILTHLIAKHCGLEAYEFVHFMGNCHLYENAIDAAKLQITREPYDFPIISINCVKDNINDYNVKDFEINNYKHHPQIKVDMVA